MITDIAMEYYMRHKPRFLLAIPVGAFVEFLVLLMKIVLKCQLVTFGGQCYLMLKGISMGLICANQLGNLYLVAMDRAVGKSLGSALIFYKRYLDDIFCIHLATVSAMQLHQLMNDWNVTSIDGTDLRSGLCVTIENSGHRVHALDLDISYTQDTLGRARLVHQAYRKPQRLNIYTPWCSQVLIHCKRALIIGELTRLLRNNVHEHDFNHHADVFLRHLRGLGYPGGLLQQLLVEYGWSNREQRLNRPKAQEGNRVVPLKLKFWDGASSIGFTKIMNRHANSLKSEYGLDKVRLLTCWLSGQNLFRMRYHRFHS